MPRPCPSCCNPGTPVPGSWCCAFREESELVFTRNSDAAEFPMVYDPAFDSSFAAGSPPGTFVGPAFYAALDYSTSLVDPAIMDRLVLQGNGGCVYNVYRWSTNTLTGEFGWSSTQFGRSVSSPSCAPLFLAITIDGGHSGAITGTL